jgi:hypothetical protein
VLAVRAKKKLGRSSRSRRCEVGEARANIPAPGFFLARWQPRCGSSAARDVWWPLSAGPVCEEGAANVLPRGLGAAPAFGGADADKIALHIGKPVGYWQHQASGAGVGKRFSQDPKLHLRVRRPANGVGPLARYCAKHKITKFA